MKRKLSRALSREKADAAPGSRYLQPVCFGRCRPNSTSGWRCVTAGPTGESRPALIYEDPSRKVRASESPPSSDAALQGPAHPCDNLGMPPTDLLEDRHRRGCPGAASSIGTISAVPNSGERVGTAASSRLLLVGGQPRISFDPIRAGSGKPGLRSGDGRAIGLTGLHVQPRLAVGDVSARQALILRLMKNQLLRPTARTARPRSALLGKTRRRGSV